MLHGSRIPHETKLLERKAGLAPPFLCDAQIKPMAGMMQKNFNCRNQAAAFLRVRFVGAGASSAFGLRPSPIVLANDERFAA